MNGYLLDTNVVSELRRPRPDPGVVRWLSRTKQQLFLSALLVGEVTRGIELLRRRDPAGAQTYQDWLDTLIVDFGDAILPITAEVATQWGRLHALRPRPVVDGLLAATAVVHRLTVVTRNVKDFEGAAVPIVDPFTR